MLLFIPYSLALINILLIIFYISLLVELIWFSVPSPSSNLKLHKQTDQSKFWFFLSAVGLVAYAIPLFYLISILFNMHVFEINTSKLLLLIGIALLIIGKIITFVGGVQIKDHINKKDTVLLDSGMFKFSRHPIALGLIATLIGLNFILPSFIMMILSVIFIFDLNRKVLMEEKKLFKQYGETYEHYCTKTNRYL